MGIDHHAVLREGPADGGDPVGVNFDPAQQVVVLEAGNFFQ